MSNAIKLNLKDLMKKHEWDFMGYPFHGRWSSSGKLVILCPYCQIHQTKKVSPGDASSAIMSSKNDHYEIWTFNCLKCHTKKRLDLFLEDMHLRCPPVPLQGQQEVLCGIASTLAKQSIQRLPRASEEEQMFAGSSLDLRYKTKQFSRLPWWEKRVEKPF